MTTLKNDRLIRALLRQPVDMTPVWVMRQAGRYLPEYRAVRKQAGDFLTLCKTPELACEVTLQPLRRFGLDAAIIFSDILTIPDAMNVGLYFAEGEGPCFKHPVRDEKAVAQLPPVDVERDLAYVTDAIRLVKRELDNSVPLIGFAGSPWTIACYMVEGGSSKTFGIIKKMLYEKPELLHQLLEKLSVSIVDYLNAQIAAGVDVLMLFDTWGGILTPEAYQVFSLAYMQRIVKQLKPSPSKKKIPTIIFTKNGGQWLETIADSGCDAVGLDWTTDIGAARKRVGNKVALQGNLDPSLLAAHPDKIKAGVAQVLAAYGAGTGHVFNLGHGITPEIPPEHVAVLVEAVHDISQQYHAK